MNGFGNPTIPLRCDWRVQTALIPTSNLNNAFTVPTAYTMLKSFGTFEVRVVVTGEAAPNDFSFNMQGGYGVPLAEGGRVYFSCLDMARDCTVVSSVLDTATYTTTVTVTTAAPRVVRTWVFTFCSYASVANTINCTVAAVDPAQVTVTITDMVSQNGWM